MFQVCSSQAIAATASAQATAAPRISLVHRGFTPGTCASTGYTMLARNSSAATVSPVDVRRRRGLCCAANSSAAYARRSAWGRIGNKAGIGPSSASSWPSTNCAVTLRGCCAKCSRCHDAYPARDRRSRSCRLCRNPAVPTRCRSQVSTPSQQAPRRQKRRERRQPHRQRGQGQRRHQTRHGGPGADRTPLHHASMILAGEIVSVLF